MQETELPKNQNSSSEIHALETWLNLSFENYRQYTGFRYGRQLDTLKTYLWLSVTLFAGIFAIFRPELIRDLLVSSRSSALVTTLFLFLSVLCLIYCFIGGIIKISGGGFGDPIDYYYKDFEYLKSEGGYSDEKYILLIERTLKDADKCVDKVGQIIAKRGKALRRMNKSIIASCLFLALAVVSYQSFLISDLKMNQKTQTESNQTSTQPKPEPTLSTQKSSQPPQNSNRESCIVYDSVPNNWQQGDKPNK